MFRLVRSFSLAIIVSLAWTCASYAQNVPITGEANIPGVGIASVRGTCDPEIEEVIRNQAWAAGQREITQNANLYARPDSVLSLSCFGSWLEHQATYAKDHFPVDPDESEGLLGGTITDASIVLVDDIITSVDPNLTSGYVQYGILEILVLDQLENVGSITEQASDASDFSACGGTKSRYIEDNFPSIMIGGRAKGKGAVPAYASILTETYGGVSDINSYHCSMMNRIWTRTKCYDFATEEDDFYELATAYTGTDHDGFYTYEDYVATAAAGDDYRVEPNMCAPPNSNIIEVPPAADIACWITIHGTPGDPAVTGLVPGFVLAGGMTWPGGGEDWATIHAAADPPAGAAGTGDLYEHRWATVSGDVVVPCAAPIRTGYVVYRKTSQYYDAVCPNPGCFFDAPGSLAGAGSCVR